MGSAAPEVIWSSSGRIAELSVAEGDWVNAGQPVAVMETSELDAQRHAAQAAVRRAEQQKLRAEALLRQRRSEVVTIEAEFERVEKLARDGFFSEAQLDAHRTALETARADLAAAEAGVPLSEATIAAAGASVGTASKPDFRCNPVCATGGTCPVRFGAFERDPRLWQAGCDADGPV